MDNFEPLLNEIKSQVMNEESVKEYFRLKQKLDSDEELKALDLEIKRHQKKMCENEDNDEIYKTEKIQYDALKERLESNPVWINFQTIKEEVYSLLLEIKAILS